MTGRSTPRVATVDLIDFTYGGLMRRSGLTFCLGSALVAALLIPGTQASSSTTLDAAVESATSGAECEWGTQPVQVIPTVDYPRGYLFGGDWRWDYPVPDEECSLGPVWTPLRHQYPYTKVLVNASLYGGADVDSRLCTGLDDPSCSPDPWAEIYAESAFGYCDEASDFNCIESIQVISPDGTVQEARYQRGFPEWPEIPEFNDGNIFMPAGGAVPLWEYDTPSGTAQLLSVGMTHTVFRPLGGRWALSNNQKSFSFGLRPVRIEARPGIPKPTMTERIDPSTGAMKFHVEALGHPAAQGCAAIDEGQCALDTDFPVDHRFRVSMRLRDESAMYLNGAVGDPVIYSEELEGGHRFIIEAAPLSVLGLAGWIPKSQIPRSLVDQVFDDLGFNYNWDVDVYASSYHALGRGGDQALAWLNALTPYFGDRASFVVDAWYLENTPNLGEYTRQCLNQGKGDLIGIVSSNATAYTGNPPEYDRATNTLRYEVAGPHYMPDGETLSKGRYSINMNAEFVKCILGVDKVPTQARVELIYPDGEASAATLAVKQDKNFLRLYYENFTFSNPTVSVKFPKTLICTKGKGKKAKTKQVTAFQCPKGWRPKR
jgi:hypothetical protein